MISRKTLNHAFEAAGKEAAKLYLAVLGIAILVAFPVMCAIGLLYLGAELAGLIGGGTSAVTAVFFGFPFLVLLFFSVYGWSPHARSAVYRALDELKVSD